VPAGTGTARESKIFLPWKKKKNIISVLPHTSTAAVKVSSGLEVSAIGWLMQALLIAAGACVMSYRYLPVALAELCDSPVFSIKGVV
jgi:hypothetical protein